VSARTKLTAGWLLRFFWQYLASLFATPPVSFVCVSFTGLFSYVYVSFICICLFSASLLVAPPVSFVYVSFTGLFSCVYVSFDLFKVSFDFFSIYFDFFMYTHDRVVFYRECTQKNQNKSTKNSQNEDNSENSQNFKALHYVPQLLSFHSYTFPLQVSFHMYMSLSYVYVFFLHHS